MMSKFISVVETHFQNTKTALKNQQASIQGLENQIGQLTKMISERPPGSLPSNTKPNPKEHVKVGTLRSGKVLVEFEKKPPQEAERDKEEEEKPKNNDNPMPKEYEPPTPYPANQAHGRALGRAQTTGGNTAKRYDHVKTEQKHFPNTRFDKLPRPCNMAAGNPAKLTRACDMSVPTDCARACQNNTGVLLHTWAWEKRTKNDMAVQHGRELATLLEKVLHDYHVLPDRHDNLFTGHCGCGTQPLPPPEITDDALRLAD
ncbi:hypothetical protein GOBAR_AA38546 [Gossypium barbadense]|uniref:Uncharacterized protein n=1 Tax=Gossypium barbadense TaxID=3634 RepID=A0A2P5VTL0_GOSBA|nr:hypothetical protein GOBAR_AA38546 [Gossypium barbadense]